MEELIEWIIEYKRAIVGSVLLACLGSYLAWRNNRKSRYAAACGKFRSSVLNALLGLYPSPVNWPPENMEIIKVLKHRFPELQSAVAEFRPYVPLWRRWLFDVAWRKYLNGKRWSYGTRQDYDQYIPGKTEWMRGGKLRAHSTELTYKSTFARNVSRLLSYAKEA